MNREIKYRIWIKEENKMLYGKSATSTSHFTSSFAYRKRDVDLMQYTGYNDKNNREVYEEDFIPYHFDESKIGVVKYGGYKNICDDQHALHIGFYVDWQDEHLKMTCRKDLGFWLKVSEVAGNTFEGLYKR